MRPVARPGGSMNAHSLPDMTPMVDVVMVILIFFMASSSLVGQELLMRARVAPEPTAVAATPLIAPAALVIRLRATGSDVLASGLGLNERPVADVIARIQTRAGDLREGQIPIVVEPTAGVPYQRVIDVLAALERAGVREVAVR